MMSSQERACKLTEKWTQRCGCVRVSAGASQCVPPGEATLLCVTESMEQGKWAH